MAIPCQEIDSLFVASPTSAVPDQNVGIKRGLLTLQGSLQLA